MENAFVIAPMNEKNVSQVAMLEEACFSAPWSEESLREVLGREEFLYLTVCEGDEVLGYGGVYFAADEANITNIAVRSSARRRGIGNRIVNAILTEAKRRGATTVYLEVRVGNDGARRLYERCGFTLAGVRRGFYDKPKEDGCVYVCPIA